MALLFVIRTTITMSFTTMKTLLCFFSFNQLLGLDAQDSPNPRLGLVEGPEVGWHTKGGAFPQSPRRTSRGHITSTALPHPQGAG